MLQQLTQISQKMTQQMANMQSSGASAQSVAANG